MKKVILIAVVLIAPVFAEPIDYTKADAEIVRDNQQDTAINAIRDSKNSVILELRRIIQKLIAENKQLKESKVKEEK